MLRQPCAVVLYGDVRPIHAIARRLAAARGLAEDELIGASARALLARERATPGWVEIRTVDRLGRPAPGIPVAVRLADGREVPGRTDSDGVLRLADVPPGPVSVEVRALP